MDEASIDPAAPGTPTVASPQCPPPESLEALATGVTPSPLMQAHLDACAHCRNSLERIRENNQFLGSFAVRGSLPSRRAPDAGRNVEIPGYDIVREIHRGGQGVVYQAVQRSTRRDVAVKVMRQGPFATLADRSRFEREVEILSRLEHPNIVAVHDAGATAGFHYFVMNYVDGSPLDEWAAAAGLPDILGGFIKVCDAVHVAHLRGVIHRDLKPSNIRVDRHGEPHVLDFGLAKSADSLPDSAMTRTGQFVGSLPWASPEQVEGTSSKIDLRTDVYSLGAILYQLLTGVVPFDVGSNLRDVLDDILLREPRRPSSLVTAAGGPSIDDELDTIVLKCLSKDRERRYQSAGELARDLRRYLADEAIEAKRDSAWYVIRKVAWRKRRVLLALAVPALLLPIAGFAVYRSSAAARQAAQERNLREIEATRNAAVLEITRRLQARPGAPIDSPGGRLNKLNAASIRTDLDTGGLSVSDYGVAMLVAETLRDRGTIDAIVEAESLVRQAIYMLGREHGPDHPETGRLRTVLADLLLRRGTRMAEAEQTAERAIAELTTAFGPASPETARARLMLARIRLARGDANGAMTAAREAFAADESAGSIQREEVQATIAKIHAELGQPEQARGAYLDALRDMLRRTHDTNSPLLDTLEIGAALLERGALRADDLFDAAALRPPLAAMPPAAALRDVTSMLRGGADGTERDAHYVPARLMVVALRERLLGKDDPSLGASLASAASSMLTVIIQSARYDAALTDDAIDLFQRAIPLQIAAHGPDSPLVGKSYEKLATCLVEACRMREATQWFAMDCELWMRQPPERRDDYQVMIRARWTAWHAARAGAFELGLSWSDRALDLIAKSYGPEHSGNALMHACRAYFLAGLGRAADSREAESRSRQIMQKQPVPEDQRIECVRFIALACILTGRVDEAHGLLESVWEVALSRRVSTHGVQEYALAMLTLHRALGDDTQAAEFERYLREDGRGDIQLFASTQPAPRSTQPAGE